jgi:membrane protein implicated in regulation of membrane protease activity
MGVIFLAALVFALGVLALQFLGGSSESNGEAHVPPGDAHHPPHEMSGALAIFLSLRFWTFGLLAFGMLGALLHFLKLASGSVTVALASAVGLSAGLLVTKVFQLLQGQNVDSSVHVSDAVGHLGKVLVPCGRLQPGKVRVEVRGTVLDLIATTDDEQIENGAAVLVVDVRGTTAQVSRAPEDLLLPRR